MSAVEVAAAPNLKRVLPAFAVAAAVPLNVVLLKVPKLVSCLSMVSEDGKSEVAGTLATGVAAVAEPNLNTGAAGNDSAGIEVGILPLEATLVETLLLLVVGILLIVLVKMELLDEFLLDKLKSTGLGEVEAKDPLLRLKVLGSMLKENVLVFKVDVEFVASVGTADKLYMRRKNN